MPTSVVASSLLQPLIRGPRQRLFVAHTGRLAVQLSDQRGRVVAVLQSADTLWLPHALVLPTLPQSPSPISVGGGALWLDGLPVPVARWWKPARPRLSSSPGPSDGLRALTARWETLLGAGVGLTPYGDDVLCGALVAGHATGHCHHVALAEAVRSADLERRTTATSAALLRFAADGWCIAAVADYLHDLDRRRDAAGSRARLLAVGSTSGRGLLEGIHCVIDDPDREAAA